MDFSQQVYHHRRDGKLSHNDYILKVRLNFYFLSHSIGKNYYVVSGFQEANRGWSGVNDNIRKNRR